MMRRTMILLSLLAAVFYLGSTAALAQRGRGAGGGPPSGGPSGPGMRGGGSQTGMPSQMPMPPKQGKQGDPAGTPRGGDMPRSGPGDHSTGRPEQAGREPQTGQQPTIGEQLERNTKLASRLQGVLPAGTNLQQASAGFKNLGDFVAAAHVSHNLSIPLGDLQARVTSGKSLGEAIHELRPNVDHNAETKKAQEQARKDQQESRP